MPNWCYNSLSIKINDSKASKEQFKKFLEKIGADIKNQTIKKNFFNNLYPMPEILSDDSISDEDKMAATGYKDWYDWHTEEWGTKWDVDENEIAPEITENSFYMSYDTAWSPAISLFENKFQFEFANLDVSMSYSEEGMGVEGDYTITDGVSFFEERDIKLDEDEFDEDGNYR